MLGRLTLATVVALGLHLGAVAQEKPPAQAKAPDDEPPEKGKRTGSDKLSPEKPILVRDLASNVRVRLVAARVSERRGGNLMAKFETVGKEPSTRVVTFPAHSFTTHEQTLRAVIVSCTKMADGLPDEDGWHPAKIEAFFSMPKEDAPRDSGRYSQFDRCFLVGIELKSK